MRDVKYLAIGIARLTGVLLFMFALIVAGCEAPTIKQQVILGCVALVMMLAGAFLAHIGTEDEYVN